MDSAYIAEWANLLLRWLHLIAAMAWIGASFYFMALDQSLVPPKDRNPLVRGEQWSIHGGGFYHKQKYIAGPAELPAHLHWSKWEAYWTWMSGFALFVLMYWFQASTYLIDPDVADLAPWEAIAISAGLLLLSWAIYDVICRTPLGDNGMAMAVIGIIGLGVTAYVATRIFSGRGAYLQVGAMIGTIMAANVLMVIIPGQKKMVAAVAAGTPIDPRWGGMGKQRSIHNNYTTLPVVFLMISPHYPMFWQHPKAWLLLVAMALVGALVRQFFNLRHQGMQVYDFWLAGGVVVLLVAVFIRPPHVALPAGGAPAFAEIRTIVEQRCVECHQPRPSNPAFAAAPKGFVLHTPSRIQRQAQAWVGQVRSEAMPPNNSTGITPEERGRLLAWVAAGARAD